MGHNLEVLSTFFEEAWEHLEVIESEIRNIENSDKSINLKVVNDIFRYAHSLKASSNLLGFNIITRHLHYLESYLDKFRKEEIKPNKTITRQMLNKLTHIKALIKIYIDQLELDIQTET